MQGSERSRAVALLLLHKPGSDNICKLLVWPSRWVYCWKTHKTLDRAATLLQIWKLFFTPKCQTCSFSFTTVSVCIVLTDNKLIIFVVFFWLLVLVFCLQRYLHPQRKAITLLLLQLGAAHTPVCSDRWPAERSSVCLFGYCAAGQLSSLPLVALIWLGKLTQATFLFNQALVFPPSSWKDTYFIWQVEWERTLKHADAMGCCCFWFHTNRSLPR